MTKKAIRPNEGSFREITLHLRWSGRTAICRYAFLSSIEPSHRSADLPARWTSTTSRLPRWHLWKVDLDLSSQWWLSPGWSRWLSRCTHLFFWTTSILWVGIHSFVWRNLSTSSLKKKGSAVVPSATSSNVDSQIFLVFSVTCSWSPMITLSENSQALARRASSARESS